MNFLNHRQKSRCHVLPLPEGLHELMSDISREVLRCQPSIDCTYKFIADYLEAMLKTREKSKVAMEIIEDAILKTDEVYSQFVKCNIPKDKTTNFLNMMEITFRKFVEQKRKRNQDLRFIKFHADDMLEELIRKCDMTKIEVLRSRPAIQWAFKRFLKTYIEAIEGTLDTEDLYFNTESLLTSLKETKSAITIQKTFRGYKTRKTILKTRKQSLSETDSSSSFTEFLKNRTEPEHYALKSQASHQVFHLRKVTCCQLHSPLGSKDSSLSEHSHEIPEPKKKVHLMPLEMVSTASDENLSKRSTENTEDNQNDLQCKPVFDSEFETNVNFEEINKAAIKIQSTFKGYKVRKEMHNIHNEKERNTLDGSDIQPNDSNIEK